MYYYFRIHAVVFRVSIEHLKSFYNEYYDEIRCGTIDWSSPKSVDDYMFWLNLTWKELNPEFVSIINIHFTQLYSVDRNTKSIRIGD